MLYLFLTAFVFLVIQRILAIIQYKNMTHIYKEVRCRHKVFAVGQHKKWGMKSIAMIGCDEDSTVKEAYLIKGFSVFEKFRALPAVEGKSLSQFKDDCQSEKRMEAFLNAIQFIEKGLESDPI